LKLSENLNSALNQQILIEYKNSLIYKQIESWCEDNQLKNLSKYFKDQSLQEKSHADKFASYINDRTNGKVTLDQDVDAPNLSINNIDEIGQLALETEISTTESIEELFDLALSEKSYIDLGFLQEMLSEQVEEEDWANRLAMNLKMTKDIVLFDATFEV
jgi:ferritin